jgi:hypothetical protein
MTMKSGVISARYDDVTGVYVLSNPETKLEVSLPKKLTSEMHKIMRGK